MPRNFDDLSNPRACMEKIRVVFQIMFARQRYRKFQFKTAGRGSAGEVDIGQ